MSNGSNASHNNSQRDSDNSWLSVADIGESCPICGKPDWCAITTDRRWALCHRIQRPDAITKSNAHGIYYLYNLSGDTLSQSPEIMPEWIMNRKKNAPCADPDTLNKFYSALLSKITLSEPHKQNLLKRGLPEHEIASRFYRSFPESGHKAIMKEMRGIFGDAVLHKIPGAFIKEAPPKNTVGTASKIRRWWSISGCSGIVIPIRGSDGRIASLRIRKDVADARGKMMSVSSAKKGGPSCGAHVHWPIPPDGISIDCINSIFITEGELKADVVTAISSGISSGNKETFGNGEVIYCVSIPGVGSWAKVFPLLKNLPNITTIILAFDMDAKTTPEVAENLKRFAFALSANGYEVDLLRWDDAGGTHKGLDDLLAAGLYPERISGDEVGPLIDSWLQSAYAAKPPKHIEDLQKSREFLKDFASKTKADPGYPFEEKSIMAISIIRKNKDFAEMARIKKAARGSTTWRDIEAALDEWEKNQRRILQAAAGQANGMNGSVANGLSNNTDGNNIPPNVTNGSSLNDEADKSIDDFNKEHAIIAVGSNVLVLWEKEDPTTGLMTWYFVTKSHFILYYENVTVLVKGENNYLTVKKAAQHWLEHPRRRFYKGIIFEPQNDKPGYFNIWKGFGCKAKPGDWSLFREHILENICDNNQDHFNYLLAWMADAVQNPAKKPGVAVVLCGEQGTGKGRFADCFGHLFGRHYKKITKSSHLVGNFNAHLQEALILFADEAFWAGDRQGESALKAEITENTRVLEMKGKDPIEVPNLTRFILASNADWVIPAGHDERRYFVLDISSQQRQQHEYFEKLTEQMENGGYEALLYDLLHMDISTINLRQAPNTGALLEQKFRSFDSVEKFWHEILHRGTILKNDEDWRGFARTDVLHNEYIEMAIKLGVSYRSEPRGFGKKLRKMCLGIVRRYRTIEIYNADLGYSESRRIWCLEFPSLAECRSSFEIYLKNAAVDWAQDTNDLKAQREPGSDDGDDILFETGTENGTVAVNTPF